MRERLVVLAIIVVAALDVVLVAAALRRDDAPPPSIASGATSPGLTTPQAPTDADVPTTAPGAQRPDLLLSLSSDGTILRANAGSCESPDHAGVGLSTDGGLTFDVVLNNAPQVLSLSAVFASFLGAVEANDQCEPIAEHSQDGGRTWATTDTQGRWHLDVDTDARSVHAPQGDVSINCVPRVLSAIGATTAFVGCSDSSLRTTLDAGLTWQQTGMIAGLVGLAFGSTTEGLALATQPGCAAAVLSSADSGETWQQSACLNGDVPEAIAVAGDSAIAQVDGVLRASDDRGQTWRRVR